MNRLNRLLSTAFASIALFASSHALADAPLKDGDRVVFYGDSITEQRLYTRYLQQYVDCRYPNLNVRFFNAGWGGDTAPGGLRRLERDVLVLKPTVVTLFFGMNDGHYKAFEQATADEYRAGMEGIIKRLQQDHVRVIIYTPGAVDDVLRKPFADSHYNDTLQHLGDVCRDLGKQYGCAVLDVHGPMVAYQDKKHAQDEKWTMIPDGVHPSPAGHLVMMRAMIPALAEPMPALPAIDSLQPDNWMEREGDTWRVSLHALPGFWIEDSSRELATDAGVIDYVCPKIVIKNLPAGNYEVSAGSAPQTFTAEQLAAGTPVMVNTNNGRTLNELVHQKEDLYYQSWRSLRVPMSGDAPIDPVLKSLEDADAALSTAIHEVANRTDTITIRIEPAPAGTNFALRKPYEVSDPNSYNWGIGGLTDGSWEAGPAHSFATGDKDAFPKTATIDLQSPQTLDSIRFGVPDFGSTKTAVLSVSEDGKTFKEVGHHEFQLHKNERIVFKFEPTTARYVRVTYPDHYADTVNYTPTFSFATELEAYGPAK